MVDAKNKFHPRPTDSAFLAPTLKTSVSEPTYGGALSFMRRRYTRDLTGVDVAVWGIPFDAAVSNRPGARFGPQGIRRASAIFDCDPQYPFFADPFEKLAVIDYGDCSFDYGRHWEVPGCIETQAGEILASGTKLLTLGGDHYVTWPLLKAHAAIHGPLALVQFDAHQDTWGDQDDRIDHGSFVGKAVKDGVIDPERSVQIGIRTHAPKTCGLEIIHGYELQEMTAAQIAARILGRTGGAKTYVTFDIDCLDPAYAPGTGTPVAGGPSSAQMLNVIANLRELNMVGMDVVEVAPAYDHADITSIAGATVAQHYLGLLAARA